MTPARAETSSAPAASTVRFALLIAVVVATSGFIFLAIQNSVPANSRRLGETVAACEAAQRNDPAFTAPVVTLDDLHRVDATYRRLQNCMGPVLWRQAIIMVAGVALLFGLAAVLYLVHPVWIVRRRRLRKLSGAGPLRDDLVLLRRITTSNGSGSFAVRGDD